MTLPAAVLAELGRGKGRQQGGGLIHRWGAAGRAGMGDSRSRRGFGRSQNCRAALGGQPEARPELRCCGARPKAQVGAETRA